ncbi:hypothetical protein C8J57DRAFT_1357029 [Mycena rebaudengoi]|nr:hypothetical protein C8J57DRAFT_1357029 [Mycena rebaudengoi]
MHTLPVVLFIWAFSRIGAVNAYVARAEGDTLDSAPIAFAFIKIASMVTCTQAEIDWFSASAPPVKLTITNDGVLQPSSPSSTLSSASFKPHTDGLLSRRDLAAIREAITNESIDSGKFKYTWPIVNVPPGLYIIQAAFDSSSSIINSTAFLVSEGADTSCVVAATSSPSSPASTTSGSPTSTGSGGPITPPPESLPVNAASSSLNRGAIAGGVIGGLAVIFAAVAAYFYLRFASASSAGAAASKKRNTRKWGGLSSTDSKSKPYPATSRAARGGGRLHSQSDSLGPMISQDNVYVIGTVAAGSRGANEDADEYEINSYYSPSQEKVSAPVSGSPERSPFSDSGHIDEDGVPLDLMTAAAATSNITRNSSTSTASYMPTSNFSRPRSHPSSPTMESASPFGNSTNNNTSSSSSLGHPSEAPPSDASRRGSAGEPIVAGTRRTPRKPVPRYNPTDPSLSAPPMPPPVPESDSSREGSVRGAPPPDAPILHHKASFGAEGRAVHYLIPDMPPPPRD